jgi:NAD(P)-dependent dehydrogenase (short-subunit alcohol dehydrogenase family)
MNRLNNKVSAVLGGAKGIGLAISQRFAHEGHPPVYFSPGRRVASRRCHHRK